MAFIVIHYLIRFIDFLSIFEFINFFSFFDFINFGFAMNKLGMKIERTFRYKFLLANFALMFEFGRNTFVTIIHFWR